MKEHPLPARSKALLVLVAAAAVCLGSMGCTEKPQERIARERAEFVKTYGQKTSLLGTRWAAPKERELDVGWLPTEFRGGVITMVYDAELNVDTELLIEAPAIADRRDSSETLRVYEAAKRAISQRVGQPSSSDEHNYYAQHTPLNDCLDRQVQTTGDRAPSCIWTTSWFDGGQSVHLEIRTGDHRVVIREYGPRVPSGGRRIGGARTEEVP